MATIQLWTLVAIAVSAGALSWLEHRFPYNEGQRLFRDGFWNDLILYCFVQSYVLGLVIARIVAWLDVHVPSSRWHLVASWSLLAQLAFFTVTHDLYIYLFHRLQHRSPLLWRLHEAHHSPRSVDWLSGIRSHSLEILINQTVEFAPLVLLGASPAVIVLKGAVSAIWGMFIHSNVDVRLGPMQYLFNGPEMHRWHHDLDDRAQGKNFSTKLAIWDWLFGTAFFPDRRAEKAGHYGLSDRDYPEAFPSAYFIHHAIPFMNGNAVSSPVTEQSSLSSPSPRPSQS